MTSVAVVMDSTAFMPVELTERLGIRLVSLTYAFDGRAPQRECDLVDLAGFFAELEQATQLPITAPPSEGDFEAAYRGVDPRCEAGVRFAEAPDADLTALEAAFAPVYANLRWHPETRAFIERIQALKRSTAPEPGLSIPSDCTGKAPEQPAGGSGTAPAHLNGTYRYVLTQEDADKVGDPEAGLPQVITITLKDGHLEGGCFGAKGGTYTVEDDRITFDSVEYDPNVTVSFAVDEEGNLHLTPVSPIDPGAAFSCFYKPWTKID